jgi:DNA ligase (NAD+)
MSEWSIDKLRSLDLRQARKLLKELDQSISKHDDLYYNKQAPEINDTEYDRLVSTLKFLEENFAYLAGSSTKLQSVGIAPASTVKIFHHSSQMLSLDNAFGLSDMVRFRDRILKSIKKVKDLQTSAMLRSDLIFEPKIDGVSLAIHYENGNLVRAGTRGDGLVGEGIFQPVTYCTYINFIKNTPLSYLL